MKPHRALLLVALLFSSVSSLAQARIVIPAGTPEDQALVAISNETDPQKHIAMLEEFVQKFASNPQAVAYGNWQLAQQYQNAGDLDKALACGDKALAAMPDVMDIIVSQVNLAQLKKDYAKVVDYAARGAAAFNKVAKQAKPEGISDTDFAARVAADKKELEPNYQYVETAAYNAIVTEQDGKQRMDEIERFTAGFPGSGFSKQVMTLAVVTLQQMNDPARMASFADKAVAASPDDVQLLVALASAFAGEQSGAHLAKAAVYARKAIDLTKDTTDQKTRELGGVAHSALGWSMVRQEKALPGVAELRTATTLLKDDPPDLAEALFRLGYASAKLNRAAEAIQALTRASQIEGPYQKPAQEMLARIKAAR